MEQKLLRTEWVRKGRVPLQTLRADIDYSSKVQKQFMVF
jgi:ribosomal protein S3